MTVSSDIVRFGVFELDRRAGELRKAGVRLSLQPQPLQVLSLLLERPGQVVTRDELRRQLWLDDTFVDFQHGLNAAVNRLRETLGDSAETPRFIETLPRRGYRFIGSVDRPVLAGASNDSADGPASTPTGPPNQWSMRPTSRRTAVGAAVALGVLSTGAWWAYRSSDGDGAPMRVVPLTTLRGHESWPTFSPDGRQVAFAWDGEQGDNLDIYVKMVGRSEVRRLTSDPLADSAPSWSPDGQHVAFVRQVAGHERLGGVPMPMVDPMGVPIGRIHLASPLGGSDLKLSDFRVEAPLAWTPDGRYLAAQHTPESGEAGPAGIYLVPVDGGEPRALTTVTGGTRHVAPAFSRDGRRLAYGSCVGHGCEIYVVALRDGFVPSGPARQLTDEHSIEVGSITWTRDGRSLVFGSVVAAFVSYLWRLDVDARSPPERIELAGIGATMPATALANDQLAFARSSYDMDIYRFQPGRPPEAIVASTFAEAEPRYSPDGRRIAFTSARSGSRSEIWVAEADGTNPRQLTRNVGLAAGSPSWSPDGRRIAFDSLSHRGFWNIWVIDADGGTPYQITTAAGQQHVPTWSKDGRWVYFSAMEESSLPRSVDIWRVPADGGPPERLTRGGTGMFACETTDGTQLLYQAADADSALMSLPLAGGPPRQLVACVKSTAFGAGPRGVYYVPCDTSADPPLRLLDPETGREELLGKLERLEQGVGAQPWGLSISPDGASVLYLRHMSGTSDLMLIENYR